jgi:hypothetical protein
MRQYLTRTRQFVGLWSRSLRSDERGIALGMSLGILLTLTIGVTTTIAMSSEGARHANTLNAEQRASALAEAGANDALGVLNGSYPDAVNAYPGDASLLPLRSTSSPGGTSWWCGTLDTTLAVWSITSYGVVANPSAAGGSTVSRTACGSPFAASSSDIVRKVTLSVPVYPDQTAQAASLVWQWLYAPCDATLTNSGTLAAPLYVGCNLNIQNSLTVSDRLYVSGNLTFSGQGHMDAKTMASGTHQLTVGGLVRLDNTNGRIGTASAPIAEADLIGGCVQKNNTGYPGTGNRPCTWANSSVNVTAQNNTTMPPPPLSPPVVDWSSSYAHSYPGPRRGCSTATGSPPVFESSGNSTLDASLDTVVISPALAPAAQNITPPTSYTCKTAGGELSWDATNRVLTVDGSVFVDGSVTLDLSWAATRTATYNSVGTLWASGTILVKNSSVCAVAGTGGRCETGSSGTGSCTTSGSWDPGKCLLILAAKGNGSSGGVQGQVAAGDGIEVKSGSFQGGAFATASVESSTTGEIDGPMISSTGTILVGQTSVASFPAINFLNEGAPGDTTIGAATLGPPTSYAIG